MHAATVTLTRNKLAHQARQLRRAGLEAGCTTAQTNQFLRETLLRNVLPSPRHVDYDAIDEADFGPYAAAFAVRGNATRWELRLLVKATGGGPLELDVEEATDLVSLVLPVGEDDGYATDPLVEVGPYSVLAIVRGGIKSPALNAA